MKKYIRIFALALALATVPEAAYAATTPAAEKLQAIDTQISDQQKEIDEINRKITELSTQKNATTEQAQAIALTVEQLKAELSKAQVQLAKTKSTMSKVQVEQEETTGAIGDISEDITEKKKELTYLVRLLYEHEGQSLIRILFNSQSLSEVIVSRDQYEELQQRAVSLIAGMHEKQQMLAEKKEELDQQSQDLGQLQLLLDMQAKDISEKRKVQNQFLAEKQQEAAQFENLIAEAQAAREEIKQKIFTLQSGKVNVSLNTATDMAKFASSVTGVRSALIMAVLKVESNVGANIGSGVFPDDMHPQSRDAFVRLTKKLGLDPQKAQISRRPASGKGWGGAMGPAQVMPATWEAIEGRIEQLMKKSPVNPYELSDAFVATAVFLADRGAADPAKEYEAVNRYIAGPNWQYYTWYGDKVLAVAKEYEAQGL